MCIKGTEHIEKLSDEMMKCGSMKITNAEYQSYSILLCFLFIFSLNIVLLHSVTLQASSADFCFHLSLAQYSCMLHCG
jgi:hypothetical protein